MSKVSWLDPLAGSLHHYRSGFGDLGRHGKCNTMCPVRRVMKIKEEELQRSSEMVSTSDSQKLLCALKRNVCARVGLHTFSNDLQEQMVHSNCTGLFEVAARDDVITMLSLFQFITSKYVNKFTLHSIPRTSATQ